MIKASYNVSKNQWTNAIDAALAEWSKHVVGPVSFDVAVELRANYEHLASLDNLWMDRVGVLPDGRTLRVPNTVTQILGGDDANPSAPDFKVVVNSTADWSLYDLKSLMIHEIGHALFMYDTANGVTPFRLWAETNNIATDLGPHLAERAPIMHPWFYWGEVKSITARDLEAAGQSGVPTHGDDRIYITTQNVDAGDGHDTAIWLGTFDGFNASLTNVERLELRGADPLTHEQSDIYRLYAAAFGREPDLDGFTWWVEYDVSLDQVALLFTQSDEYAAMHGGDRASLVGGFYENILGRAPDLAGLDYWLASDLPDHMILAGFALSPENSIDVVGFTV